MSLAILVPVLGRPQNVAPLLASIEESTPEAHVYFIGDPHDEPERHAIEAYAGPLKVSGDYRGGNYAEKINYGVKQTRESLVFTAADDLRFLPGWFEAAKAHLTDGIEVVGVNDLIPRNREHATHFLMTREYAERPVIDGDPGPFYWGYHHWYCDDELVGTAKYRGTYAYAEDALVEHLHYMNDKAEDDDIYRKGRERWRQDRRLFLRRAKRWT